MKVFVLFVSSFLILSLMSCSSISVKHDYDPEIDFTTYKTFSLYDNAIRGDALILEKFYFRNAFYNE